MDYRNKAYHAYERLSVIMKDPIFHKDKYGSWSHKTVTLHTAGKIVYQASYALLSLLFDRYGDISFQDAMKEYGKEVKIDG